MSITCTPQKYPQPGSWFQIPVRTCHALEADNRVGDLEDSASNDAIFLHRSTRIRLRRETILPYEMAPIEDCSSHQFGPAVDSLCVLRLARELHDPGITTEQLSADQRDGINVSSSDGDFGSYRRTFG